MLTNKSDIAEAMGVMPLNVELTSDRFPEIKNWRVGSEYTVTITGKLTGIHENYDGKSLVACLSITDPESKAEDNQEPTEEY